MAAIAKVFRFSMFDMTIFTLQTRPIMRGIMGIRRSVIVLFLLGLFVTGKALIHFNCGKRFAEMAALTG
ncbi:hypothetical protein BEH76_05095 [Shewanella algae]|nr:hypothetical protein BEH76_05095 [Shewanella algae]